MDRRNFLVSASASLGLAALGLNTQKVESQQRGTQTPLITLFMSGGCSAFESFNPRTPSSPSNLKGPLSSIQTSIPGVSYSEVFPELARRNSQFSHLRNLNAGSSDHVDSARNAFLRGRVNVSETIGDQSSNGGVPYAFLNPNSTWFAVNSVFHQSNSLAPPYQNGRFVPPTMTVDPQLTERRRLLEGFESGSQIHSPVADRMQRFRETAFDLMQGGGRFAEAFNLPEQERDRYGRNLAGDGMLLARRLVERGAGAVTLYFEPTGTSFDLHSGIEEGMKQWAPMVDRASSAIIDDITQNRIDCTFLLTTEFNRTDSINSRGGRDHNSEGNQAIIAGGKSRKGVVYSNRIDQRPNLPNTILSVSGVELPPAEPRIRDIIS